MNEYLTKEELISFAKIMNKILILARIEEKEIIEPNKVKCVSSRFGFTKDKIYNWPCPIDDNGEYKYNFKEYERNKDLFSPMFYPVYTNKLKNESI